MRVALYARYSAGPRQTDQSIEGQIRECTDFCVRKGFEIAEVYADRHISGKTDDRPEFQRLIADSKKKKFEGVVVWKTDRFARNKYDSAIYKRLLRQNGVQIFYAAETIPDGPEGIILESLMEGLAEYYSSELSQKVKRGLHESALKCRVLGPYCSFGYRKSAEGTYEIDPDAAKGVQMIFDMYIAGETNNDICQRMNNLGFKTGRGHKFTKSSLARIIQNENYIGVYNSAGVHIEDGMPALISKEKYYLAQLERQRRTVSKTNRKESANYILSGKLFCGYCQKAMHGVSGTSKNKKKFYYYYCKNTRGAKKTCHKKPVSKDWIENLVVEKTVTHILQPEIITQISDALYIVLKNDSPHKEDLSYFTKKLKENEKACNNILKAIEKGLATDTLLERLDCLESEKIALESELAFHKSKRADLSKGELLYYLGQFLEPENKDWDKYKKMIIECFIKEVYLFDDHFVVYYNINNDKDEFSLESKEGNGGSVFDERSTNLV